MITHLTYEELHKKAMRRKSALLNDVILVITITVFVLLFQQTLTMLININNDLTVQNLKDSVVKGFDVIALVLAVIIVGTPYREMKNNRAIIEELERLKNEVAQLNAGNNRGIV